MNATPIPSPWSAVIPNLQLAWDATSLGALQFCPRSYQYSIAEGYRTAGDRIDLEFGILVHRGVETFSKARLRGLSIEDARLEALAVVLEESGTRDPEWTPWSGRWSTQWKCLGTVPYKNAFGRRAKCPKAHVAFWGEGDGPTTCSCGSPTTSKRRWVSEFPAKDRHAAVRAVVWYTFEQTDTAHGLKPYAFPDGTPAVELSVQMPLPFRADTGETYILTGHIDSVKLHGNEAFLGDYKTSKRQLGEAYWAGWTPNTQMDTYDLLGSIALPELNLKGIVIEGIQALVGGAKFGVGILRRTEEQREEFLTELPYWFGEAERFARTDYWPMNRRNCAFCQFRPVCATGASQRQAVLDTHYVRREWNPLAER